MSLEEMVVLPNDCLNPITEVKLVVNGSSITIHTPLSILGFLSIWNSKSRKLKIPTGKNTYAYIVKRRVDFLHLAPIKTYQQKN